MVKILKDLDSTAYYGDKKRLSYSKLSNSLNTSEALAEKDIESTDNMRFGRAFHHIFLHRLIGQIVNVETHEINLKTKAGKELQEFLASKGEEYFRNGEQQECDFMCNAFFQSYEQDIEQKQVIDIFRDRGLIELTIYWTNENGYEFKSRLDCAYLDSATKTAYVLDLKADGNLNVDRLYWKYRDMNYDLQMYVYCRALIAAGYTNIKYYTLSIERETGAYCLSQYGDFDFSVQDSFKNAAFESGEKKYLLALNKYLEVQTKKQKNIPLSY
jgi:hypothetical protein